MIRILAFILCSLFITSAAAQRETIYNVQVRSFFDSNGDGHGDLKGVEQKLDYLQQLGVTSILLSPIYQSDFYHNQYANDHKELDEKYGKFKEYRDLVQNIHRRKMKVYQEIDLQYVSTNHVWFKESFKKTKSEYSGFIYYTDVKNEKPFTTAEVTAHDGASLRAVAVNLKNAEVKEYYAKTLKYWLDPDCDGNFYDGVDGFYFTDVKDSPDNSVKTGSQLKDFYTPLFAGLKKINPEIKIIAAPASGSYGKSVYKAGADAVTALKLRDAILSFDKKKLSQAIDSTFALKDSTKYAIPLLEDRTTARLASLEGMNAGKLRAAAGLSFLISGVPQLYYGQEIGMQEKKLQPNGTGMPLREAFDWYAAETGDGTAVWYKSQGNFWDSRSNKAADGISLEEQEKDPNSIWSFYKQLLRAKRMQPAIALGGYKEVKTNNDKVFAFVRTYVNTDKAMYDRVLVVVNLSGQSQNVELLDGDLNRGKTKLIIGTPNVSFGKYDNRLEMTPYAFQAWKI